METPEFSLGFPEPEPQPNVDSTQKGLWFTKIYGAEFKIQRLEDRPRECPILDNPELMADYITDRLPNSPRYNSDSESFGVVFLNTRRRAIGMQVLTNGTLDTILIHPREVFKPAIVINSAAITLFHNHPSGDPSPSQADIKVTRELIQAGQILKIEVLDHIVLGTKSYERAKAYASLREMGFFYA